MSLDVEQAHGAARNDDRPDVAAIAPARLARALRKLHFVEREAFLLKTRDGLSYAAIGLVLGLSAEAAEARVVSALIGIDRQLEPKSRQWWRLW